MQLQQVERLDFQVLKASFDEGRQVLHCVTGGNVRIESPAGFGGDKDLFPAFALQLGQQTFAMSVAVNISGVKEVDAKIDGPMQRRQ